MDYRQNPKNVWDPEQTTMGWNGITASLGRWDPDAPVFEEILGQPVCVPDSDPCVGEGMCSGTCINFAGACSWPPEEFGGMVDMWLEIHAQANPTILQHNEVRCTSLLHTYTPPHTQQSLTLPFSFHSDRCPSLCQHGGGRGGTLCREHARLLHWNPGV